MENRKRSKILTYQMVENSAANISTTEVVQLQNKKNLIYILYSVLVYSGHEILKYKKKSKSKP